MLLVHWHTTTRFFSKSHIEDFENAKRQYDSEFVEKCRLYYRERCKRQYLETITPEESYKQRKKAWLFHDTSAYVLRGESCHFYSDTGRIEYKEVLSSYE